MSHEEQTGLGKLGQMLEEQHRHIARITQLDQELEDLYRTTEARRRERIDVRSALEDLTEQSSHLALQLMRELPEPQKNPYPDQALRGYTRCEGAAVAAR